MNVNDAMLEFHVINPTSIDLSGSKSLALDWDYDTTARVEQLDFDVLCSLWNAALPLTLLQVSESAWLGAMFFRLCRAKAVALDTTTNYLSHANRREQSTTAAHQIAT